MYVHYKPSIQPRIHQAYINPTNKAQTAHDTVSILPHTKPTTKNARFIPTKNTDIALCVKIHTHT